MIAVTRVLTWRGIILVGAAAVAIRVASFVAVRIEPVHRIIEAVAEPVGSDACFSDLEPVRLEEEAQFGVVVPRVQVLQTRVGVIPLADPAFGFRYRIPRQDPFALLAEGFVEGALDLRARRIGDGGDRRQPVAVEVGGGGGVTPFTSFTAGCG